MDRRTFMLATGVGLAAPFVLRGPARAADMRLRLLHFLPPSSNLHQNVLQPWANEVQAASGGRLEVRIFAPVQRAVLPPPSYERVRGGQADIALVMASHYPGRFARLEVFELPFVAARHGIVNAQAIQEFAQKHAFEEVPDVVPLAMFGEDHGVIHSRQQIGRLEALKGARIGPATRLGARALEALGAIAPLVQPAQIAEAVQQNVLDGCIAPWEAVAALGLDQATGFHTEIPGSPTLLISVGMLVMNRQRFDALPPELRQVLVETSGLNFAASAGRAYDARNAEAVAAAAERKQPVIALPEAEKARWIAATVPVIEAWTGEVQRRGIDGKALLEEARALIIKYDQPVPAALQPQAPQAQIAPAPNPAAPPQAAPAPGTLSPPGSAPATPPVGVLAPTPAAAPVPTVPALPAQPAPPP